MANKARVKWVEGSRFMGESGSGHAVMMEGMELLEEQVQLLWLHVD